MERRSFFIESEDRVRLCVTEYGGAEGVPVVLMHGLCQSSLCWERQVQSRLTEKYRIITFDLRGHGMSDKPLETEYYTESKRWAEDLNAVIQHLGLVEPVIVAWSYSGYVLCDFIEKYGDSNIKGINFVAATVKLTQRFEMLGPGLLRNFTGMVSDDLRTCIDSTRDFVSGLFFNTPEQEFLLSALCSGMMVPISVRAALTQRELDYRRVLRGIQVPVLLSYGLKDRVVRPSMSKFTAAEVNGATESEYRETGHALFYERSERFNTELVRFIDGLEA